MSTSIFDVEFASFDSSGDSDERIKLADLDGSVVVMEPVEYVPSIETMHGVTDAVKVTIQDVSGQRTYKDQLLFQRAMVAGLKDKVGQRVLGVVGRGNAKAGKSAPWVLFAANDTQKEAAKNFLASV